MPISFQDPSIIDVTRRNPQDILYIRGNETTDGSIRFHFLNLPLENEARIELRAAGVWNKTGLIFSQGSINLGTDLRVSAVGDFLQTFLASSNPVFVPKALYGHMPYAQGDGTEPNPSAGITGFPRMPVLDQLRAEDIFDPIQDGQIDATEITIAFPVNFPNRVMLESFHRTGNIPATADVEVTFLNTLDNELLNFVVPKELMPANTNFTLIFDDFGFGGLAIKQRFKSVNTISLAKNAGGDVLTRQSFFPQSTVDILLEEFIITNDLAFIFPVNSPSFISTSRFQ